MCMYVHVPASTYGAVPSVNGAFSLGHKHEALAIAVTPPIGLPCDTFANMATGKTTMLMREKQAVNKSQITNHKTYRYYC